MGMPTDFLIDGNGRIVALKIGTHEYDRWTAEQLLTLAQIHRSGAPMAQPKSIDMAMDAPITSASNMRLPTNEIGSRSDWGLAP